MHFAFFHLVYVAKVNEEFMSLVKRKSHIAEMLYKSGKLIENQILMFCSLFVKLLFFGLDQSLEPTSEFAYVFAKTFLKSSSTKAS